jgi:preprotein translocase subunit SecG
MSFLLYTSFIIFLIVGVFLILLILIQKGRGGGLASAFGGGGGNTAFGSKTGDVLTWATSIAFGVFLLTAVALNILADRYNLANRPLVAAPAALPVPAGSNPQNGPSGPIAPSEGGTTSLPQVPQSDPGVKNPVAPPTSQP